MATEFKDKLREWRGKRRQKQAADILNVPLGTYRTWEYGKRTPKSYLIPMYENLMSLKPDTTTV